MADAGAAGMRVIQPDTRREQPMHLRSAVKWQLNGQSRFLDMALMPKLLKLAAGGDTLPSVHRPLSCDPATRSKSATRSLRRATGCALPLFVLIP